MYLEVSMCGFVGFANYKQGILPNKEIIENMNQTLMKRGHEED